MECSQKNEHLRTQNYGGFFMIFSQQNKKGKDTKKTTGCSQPNVISSTKMRVYITPKTGSKRPVNGV
jgi:hypothetical protein